jgi:hypothetical protein
MTTNEGVSRQRFLWVLYACLVAIGWWQLLKGNEANALGILGLSLGVMLTAAGASKWQRRRITAEYRLEAAARGTGGLLSRLLDAVWP